MPGIFLGATPRLGRQLPLNLMQRVYYTRENTGLLAILPISERAKIAQVEKGCGYLVLS